MPRFVSFQHDLSGVEFCLNSGTVAFSRSELPHHHSDALLLADATGDIEPYTMVPSVLSCGLDWDMSACCSSLR